MTRRESLSAVFDSKTSTNRIEKQPIQEHNDLMMIKDRRCQNELHYRKDREYSGQRGKGEIV